MDNNRGTRGRGRPLPDSNRNNRGQQVNNNRGNRGYQTQNVPMNTQSNFQNQRSRQMQNYNNNGGRRSKKPKNPYKVWTKGKIALAVILGLLLTVTTGAVVASIFFSDFGKTVGTVQHKVRNTDSDKLGKGIDNAQVGFLIMGTDNDKIRKLDSTRTDSLIYVAVNTKTHDIDMVSIPRDTYVPIYDSKGEEIGNDKINSAYTHGGEDATIETVKNWLDLPINYYITANFISFKKVVDALGGVEVTVPYQIREYDDDSGQWINLRPGTQTLNGVQALTLARTRHQDDDIKRGARQQMVLKAIIKKAMNIDSVTKYQSILDSIKDDIKTNLTFKNMVGLGGNVVTNSSKYKINNYIFDWNDLNVDGVSDVEVFADSRDYIAHRMKVILGLEDKDERDENEFVSNKQSAYDSQNITSDIYNHEPLGADNTGNDETADDGYNNEY